MGNRAECEEAYNCLVWDQQLKETFDLARLLVNGSATVAVSGAIGS